MAIHFKQFYYGSDGSGKLRKSGFSEISVQNTKGESVKYLVVDLPQQANIIKIGIQSLPGVEFYVNRDSDSTPAQADIIIGPSGIFELNLEELGLVIQKLEANYNTVEQFVKNSAQINYLIVDILYKEEN